MTDASSTRELFDLWRRQLEEGAQTWARMLGQAAPPPPPAAGPFDPMAFWRPVLEQSFQTWARAMAQTPVTPDLVGQWKQMLDQSIEAWSKALGQAMATDAFAQLLGRYLDQWLNAQAPLRRAHDQAVQAALEMLNLPSRTQLTGVARQIVELEERVEGIEDRLAEILRRLDALAGRERA